MKKRQVIIFTVITNCYDHLPEVQGTVLPSFCFVALLDKQTIRAIIPSTAAAKTTETLKTLGQRMFPLAKWIIWLDGKGCGCESGYTLNPHPELTLYCIYEESFTYIAILSRVGTATIYGAGAGVILNVALMHAKLSKEQYNEYKIWDQAYRLCHSQTQNRVDKFTFLFSIADGLTVLLIGSTLIGIPFGLLAHILIKPLQQPPIDK
ncbi:hypothetical protein I4U23_011415 [Adineta vaga]|nr:hypothetical protein I4U23_011415 [Adineta vaga]